MAAYYVGLEGIGMSLSAGVMANDQGHILAAVRILDQPISLHTTPRTLLKLRLRHLLGKLQEQSVLPISSNDRINVCIGLTGVTFEYDRKVDLPNVFNDIWRPVNTLVCTGDAEIAFASNARTNTGSAIVCHCGSTAYAVRDGIGYRYGGWGPAIGDEGSGFAMGRAALRAIAVEHDQGMPESTLWHEVRRWLNDPDPRIAAFQEAKAIWQKLIREHKAEAMSDERMLLFHYSHHIWQRASSEGFEFWRRIASGLAQALLSAYEKHDPNANRIVDIATDELIVQYINVLKIADPEGNSFADHPLVLLGGVITHNESFRTLLVRKLFDRLGKRAAPIVPGDPGTMRPACGAVLLALGGSDGRTLRLPPRRLIDSIATQQNLTVFRDALIND